MIKKLLVSQSGSIAVHIGVAIIVIVGMVALGVEITFVLYKQRQMQSVADSAALGGATALAVGYPTVELEARAIAASLGFANGSDGASVLVNNPPTSGTHAGDSNYVEVIISQPQTLAMVGLFRSSLFNVGARAEAFKGLRINPCVRTLASGNVSGALTVTGGAIVNMSECGLRVDSTSESSITASGGSQINAGAVATAGNYSLAGGGEINVTYPPVQTYSTSVPFDPYSDWPLPTPGTCLKTGYKLTGGKSDTLSPGTYCNGMAVSGGSTLKLNPGVYIINQGSLTLTGGSTFTGNGVSIFLTSSTGSNIGSVDFAGGSIVNIIAPSSGSMKDIAFFQDPRASANANNLAGGANQYIEGVVYFPKGNVTYSGGTGSVSKCIELIAWTLKFTGGSNLTNNCRDFLPIGASGTPELTE